DRLPRACRSRPADRRTCARGSTVGVGGPGHRRGAGGGGDRLGRRAPDVRGGRQVRPGRGGACAAGPGRGAQAHQRARRSGDRGPAGPRGARRAAARRAAGPAEGLPGGLVRAGRSGGRSWREAHRSRL
ncbi:MAG: RecA/RadA recombinase, partial [uncultured Frankineae bacterium]